MDIDAVHVGLALGGLVAGIVIDCNRRVRELQRNSDRHSEWLHAIITGRQPSRKADGLPPRRPARLKR